MRRVEPPWGSGLSAALCFPRSCRGNGTSNPRRVTVALYPPSFPAIKLNGHTKHPANVSTEPEPRRSVQTSRIHQWNCTLTCSTKFDCTTELTYPKCIPSSDVSARVTPHHKHRRAVAHAAAARSVLEDHNPQTDSGAIRRDFTANK